MPLHLTEIKFQNVPVSRTEDTHEVLRSRDKHILVFLLTEIDVCVCISGVAREHLGKNEPRKYTHGPYTKVLNPCLEWDPLYLTTSVTTGLPPPFLPCPFPYTLSLLYTPLQSSRKLGPVGSAAKRVWVCCSPAILHIPPYCWTASLSPLPFPEENATAQPGKNRHQDLQVILSCCQQPDALYTLADLAQCPNWSQHTWISSPSYQIEFTALK